MRDSPVQLYGSGTSLMADGTLAVVGVVQMQVPTLAAALRSYHADTVLTRPIGGDRCLVYGAFGSEDAAREAVAELRRAGWAAAQRPADDDPRIVGWRNRTQPVSVAGGTLVVCVPWAELDRNGKTIVEIDPGAAFGVGTHPTTRLILEELAARLVGGETVLDVGCGSGALALAAVRLGAKSAIGIDVDVAAIAATLANAGRNGLASQVVARAVPLQEVTGTFDVVVANIGRDVLAALAPHIEERLAPRGWLALSGISPAQVSRLATAFPRTRIVGTPQLDDWCAIVGQLAAA